MIIPLLAFAQGGGAIPNLVGAFAPAALNSHIEDAFQVMRVQTTRKFPVEGLGDLSDFEIESGNLRYVYPPRMARWGGDRHLVSTRANGSSPFGPLGGAPWAAWKFVGGRAQRLAVPDPGLTAVGGQSICWCGPDCVALSARAPGSNANDRIALISRSGDSFSVENIEEYIASDLTYVSIGGFQRGVLAGADDVTSGPPQVWQINNDYSLTPLSVDPAGTTNYTAFEGVQFSPDGLYLAYAFRLSGSGLQWRSGIWKRFANTYQFLGYGPFEYADNCTGLKWSSDGQYLSGIRETTQGLSIFRRTGDTFTAVSVPNVLSSQSPIALEWAPDRNRLALITNQGSFLFFDVTGTTATLYTDLSPVPLFRSLDWRAV